MNNREPKRVALLLPLDIAHGRGVMQGVGNYVSAQARNGETIRWRLYRSRPSMDVLPLMRRWKPSGVVAHVLTSELAESLARLRVPVVNTTTTIGSWKGPLVEVDHEAVGRMAAQHFLQRGFRSFGYVGSEWAGFSLAREAAFRAAVEEAGYSVDSCHLNYLPLPPLSQPWNHVNRKVVDWLKRMDKPAAVFASNDRPAREVADACEANSLRVPDDVAILGVDDDEYECFLGDPPLSSVVNPSEKLGWMAAELLDELMDGTEPDSVHRFLPPTHISIRQSSDAYSVDDPHLKAALILIRDRATKGLTPSEIHEEVDCSRRLLERRFREYLGRGIIDEIRRVRLDRACRLLLETKLPIQRIAELSGFADSRLLANAFKDSFGKTPGEYRESQ